MFEHVFQGEFIPEIHFTVQNSLGFSCLNALNDRRDGFLFFSHGTTA